MDEHRHSVYIENLPSTHKQLTKTFRTKRPAIDVVYQKCSGKKFVISRSIDMIKSIYSIKIYHDLTKGRWNGTDIEMTSKAVHLSDVQIQYLVQSRIHTQHVASMATHR